MLDSFQSSYFYPIEVCDQNRYYVDGISSYKTVALSIIDVHHLLHFLGTTLFIYVVTIPINNIGNQIYANIYK